MDLALDLFIPRFQMLPGIEKVVPTFQWGGESHVQDEYYAWGKHVRFRLTPVPD